MNCTVSVGILLILVVARVQVCAAVHYADSPDTVVDTRQTPLLPPAWIEASQGTFLDFVEVSWAPASGATGYRLFRSTGDNPQLAMALATGLSDTFYEDRTADPGVHYSYWVRSEQGSARSDFSALAIGYRSDPRPSAPVGLSATQGVHAEFVRLSWNLVGAAQRYEVYRAVRPVQNLAQALTTTIPGTLGQYDDYAPVGWTFYYWLASNNDVFGSSAWSDPVRGRAGRSVTWWGSEIVELQMPDSYADAVQIELGLRHGLALLPTGEVGTWGSNFYGQATVPPEVSGTVAVATGYDHSLALRGDGRVVGWGRDDKGQSSGGGQLRDLIAIAGGEAFSLGLDARGRVYAWGDNSKGQLEVPRHLPAAVAIAAGGSHGLALLVTGQVAAWGNNSHGQADVPSGLGNVQAIAAGARHSIALLEDGTVRGWGDNSHGQAPAYWDGRSQTHSGDLQPMSGPSNVVSIAAGLFHSVALLANGQVTTMSGSDGGNSAPAENSFHATLAAGENFSTALRREGEPAAVWVAPAQLAAAEGAGAILLARSLGTGRRTYQWKHAGVPIPGATGPFLRIRAVRGSDVGDYTVEVSNERGTLESEPVQLTLGGSSPAVDYFSGYFAWGNQWGRTAWFGNFYHDHFPWIWHEREGWLWCHGWGGEDIWFYQPQEAGLPAVWYWTSPQVYPHLYDLRLGNWLVFEF